MRHGLIPNRFDDRGEGAHYNSADASLWFVHAALEYRRVTGDRQAWRTALSEACRQVLAAYEEGTEGPIEMDRDGLIRAGAPDTQLTWMDAARDGVVFTPRHGKAVEINALWHRALAGCAEAFEEDDPATSARCRDLAGRVRAAFRRTFWDGRLGHLIDHVHEGGVDRSFRPNQVLAVSLGHDLLEPRQCRSVMRNVGRRLLTPMGLRTLPPDDVHYRGQYAGSLFERDRAYHQGTVWAWLMGPYVEGVLRAYPDSPRAHMHGRRVIRPLLAELSRHALGQIHEVYDGDWPHRPDGCVAQAWSVAELLRAVVLLGTTQPPERQSAR